MYKLYLFVCANLFDILRLISVLTAVSCRLVAMTENTPGHFCFIYGVQSAGILLQRWSPQKTVPCSPHGAPADAIVSPCAGRTAFSVCLPPCRHAALLPGRCICLLNITSSYCMG